MHKVPPCNPPCSQGLANSPKPMNSKDASKAYFEATVENAPPVQIIRLLYQGALRFLGQALAVELPKDCTQFNDLLGQGG